MDDKNGPNKTIERIISDTRIVMLGEEPARDSDNGHLEQGERKAAIEEAVRSILTHVGEDPEREGLKRTPHRVAKSYDELLAGYEMDPESVVNGALFDVEYDEMIVVKDIEFFSICCLSLAKRTSPTYPARKLSAYRRYPALWRCLPDAFRSRNG